MTTEINILYLEDKGLDGKKLYKSNKLTRRLRCYIKRTHDIDIKSILNDWNTKDIGPTAI